MLEIVSRTPKDEIFCSDRDEEIAFSYRREIKLVYSYPKIKRVAAYLLDNDPSVGNEYLEYLLSGEYHV